MDDSEALRELLEEHAALRRVATLVATERDPARVFAAVAEEAGRRLDARQVSVARFEGRDGALVVGAWSAPGGPPGLEVGVRVTLDGASPASLVRRTGSSSRVDDYDAVSGPLVERLLGLGIRSGVAVPVHLAGELWGVFAIQSERAHGLPPETEERASAFAELVGAALAQTGDRERLERLAAREAALRRVATLVAVEHDAPTLFAAVTEEAARVMGALQANLTRYEGEDGALVLGAWTGPGGVPGVGSGERVTLDGQTVSGLVRNTGRPARVDDYRTATGPLAIRIRDLGIRSAVGAPIRVNGELWGVLTVQSERLDTFPAGAEDRVQDFAELVAAALAEAEARERLAASRARIVEASYEARRRLERDLHDGAQQRLVALALDLRRAETQLAPAPETAAGILAEARGQLDEALGELRELARGIHPAVLTDRGLVAAVETLASRSPVPVQTETRLDGRLPASIEAAAYFVVSEALANVAKYAGASTVAVRLWQDDGTACVTVADDGVGGADTSAGSGLRGLRDRVEALGGHLDLDSPTGEGTTVAVRLPVG